MGNSNTRFYINPESPGGFLIRQGCFGFTEGEVAALFRAPFWMPGAQFASLSDAENWIRGIIRGRGDGPFYAFIANSGMANDPGTGAPLTVYLALPDMTREGREVPNYYYLAGCHAWLAKFLDTAQFRVGEENCARPAAGTNLRVNNYSVRRSLFFVDEYSDRYLDYPSGCQGGCNTLKHPFNTRDYKNYSAKTRFFYLYRVNAGSYAAPRRDILTSDIYPRGADAITSANGAYNLAIRGGEFGVYGTSFIVRLGAPVTRVKLEDDRLNAYISRDGGERVAWFIKICDETENGPYSVILQNDGRLLAYNRFNKNVTSAELAELNKGIAPMSDGGTPGGPGFFDYDTESEYYRRLRNLMAYLEIRGLLIKGAGGSGDGKIIREGTDVALTDVAFLGEYDSAVDYTRRLEQLKARLVVFPIAPL